MTAKLKNKRTFIAHGLRPIHNDRQLPDPPPFFFTGPSLPLMYHHDDTWLLGGEVLARARALHNGWLIHYLAQQVHHARQQWNIMIPGCWGVKCWLGRGPEQWPAHPLSGPAGSPCQTAMGFADSCSPCIS